MEEESWRGSARRRLSGMHSRRSVARRLAPEAVLDRIASSRHGVFALLGGTPKIVSKFWVGHPNGLSGDAARSGSSSSTAKRRYSTTTSIWSTLMHLVIVRDDLQRSRTSIPTSTCTTGTFSQRFTRDAEPSVLRLCRHDAARHRTSKSSAYMLDDAPSAAFARLAVEPFGARSRSRSVRRASLADDDSGESGAKNSTSPSSKAASRRTISVPYLGAAAHVVFINTSTFAYVHVHPMLRGQERARARP